MKDLCRPHGINDETYYNWKLMYSGMSVSELKRLKETEFELSRHKQMYAELDYYRRVLAFGKAVKHFLRQGRDHKEDIPYRPACLAQVESRSRASLAGTEDYHRVHSLMHLSAELDEQFAAIFMHRPCLDRHSVGTFRRFACADVKGTSMKWSESLLIFNIAFA